MTLLRLGQFLLLCVVLAGALALPTHAPAAPESFLAPTAEIPPLDAAPFGLNTHLASRYPDPSSMAVPAELVAQANVGWAREDIHWWRIQPTPTTWDWGFTDAAFRELIRRDIKIVGVLGHPPGWATTYPRDRDDDISFYAPEPSAFAGFARAVAQRYGRYVHHWEIWNEPDNPLFWKPAPDAYDYAVLLNETASAIRSVDSDATILLGGINPFDTHFLEQLGDYGAWNSFDILAIHPYVDPIRPEAAGLGAAADGVRTVAERFGTKPIWVTEIGWASGRSDHDQSGMNDEQDQATYLARAMLLLWQAGVERVFWYTLKDDPGNPYGLVGMGSSYDDYTQRKPAYYALQTLNRELSGATFVGLRDLFTRTTVFDFERLGAWRRGDQPNGYLEPTTVLQRSGQAAAQLSYTFPTSDNDYVVFVRGYPLPIPNQTYALGMWVYGDGSGHTLKLWLRDAEGEVLQYALGTVGGAGWRLLQTQISGRVAPWNRVTDDGNGQLDFPAAVYALVLDDAPDAATGSGLMYLDDLTAISGPEGYDLQVLRGDETVDVLWAPEGVRARLPTASITASVTELDGEVRSDSAEDGYLTFALGPAPVFVQHQRPLRAPTRDADRQRTTPPRR